LGFRFFVADITTSVSFGLFGRGY